jgi:hypothetical protein
MWIEEKELEEEMVRVDGGEVGVFGQSYGLSFFFSFVLRGYTNEILANVGHETA